MAHSATVRTAEVMRAVVSGRASRLVRRKWRGKLWKRHQASGPVNSWQLMLRAAAFQMRVYQEDAGHGQIGKLEAHAADGRRIQHQLHQKGQAEHPGGFSGPSREPEDFIDEDEQEGPDQGRRGSGHKGEKAGGKHDGPKAEIPGRGRLSRHPGEPVQEDVDYTQVEAGEGQDVGSSAFPEGRYGFPRQSRAVSREKGREEGRRPFRGEGNPGNVRLQPFPGFQDPGGRKRGSGGIREGGQAGRAESQQQKGQQEHGDGDRLRPFQEFPLQEYGQHSKP